MFKYARRGRNRLFVRNQTPVFFLFLFGFLLTFGNLLNIPLQTIVRADNTPQTIPFTQNWTNTGLIAVNDDWSGVPGIIGYRGDDLTVATGTDPQTILADGSATPVDVNANQTNPDTFATGGVTEFHITNPVIALTGSGTADAPHIVIHLNTTGQSNINVAYNLRDLDGSIDNAIQPVALQYRVGASGNYTNIAAGFVADSTTGPSQATLVTPVSVTLPAAANNQPLVQVRIMTTNAVGNDEWVGIDDINISIFGGSTPPTGVGAANPSAVTAGSMTLLTVTVTPGTNPPSTGITVTGDLTSIGGSATQMFFDNGTNGDVTPGDNIFSFLATVAIGTTPGLKMLPVTVADAQMRSSMTNISLNIVSPPMSIHDIQGSGSTSPHVSQVVTTTGIVTGTKNNGFFIQEPAPDANPSTSEGIFVFTSSAPPAAAAIGNSVTVVGTVQEFIPAAEPGSPPLTEISFTTNISVNSTGNPLPAPVTITSADTTPNNLENLERLEGMRVHVNSLTVVGPTLGNIAESSATVNSNGLFYGVITGVPRPFREPGVEITLNLPPGAPANVPRFDTNPERLRIDSDTQPGAIALDVTAGAIVSNITGPLDYTFTTWSIYPDAATPPTVSNQATARPVPPGTFNELSVASFNMQRFYDTVNDPGTSDVVLTMVAFDKRLNKASLAIRNVMRTPDVIGVVEMENLSTLQAVATKVNTDAVAAGQPNPSYSAYLVEGNDIGGIDVGFLVKAARVSVVDVTQLELAGCVQTAATCYNFINPNTGMAELLNDRPPLVLRGTIQQPGPPTPLAFTVIVNHSRSLSGVDSLDPNGTGTEGNRVRFKRRAQAEFLANHIQSRQVANPTENIAVVGDFNAFPFNDGYVDVEGTIRGTPTPPDQVTLASSDLVNPDLTNLINTLPPTERYSFTFDGNAQALDYILVNTTMLTRLTRHAYARNNGDFPQEYYEDGTRPERISDHDMPVAYFRLAVRNKAADFDGDGKADLSVFRPSNAVWYRINSSNGTFSTTPYGLSTDDLVPGDYDNDGKTDIAVFRDGDWFVLQSTNGFTLSRHFGTAGDVAVPADYDGDGRTDFAVFRPSNGTWYIEQSSDFMLIIQAFGVNGDLPVPGDYTGDGRAEIAVWRPSNGNWYTSLDPATNYGAVHFGISGDRPVQSDYDGDGRTDIAVFRPSTGAWHILQSTDGARSIQFGLATDIAVPADYDGDAKSDIAVFRDGTWYILNSIGGTVNVTLFGTSGDVPVPSAYVPQQ